MWKKCKVIPLVTTNDNKPALFKSELGYTKEYPTAGRMLPATMIHLYILSDDEIKEGDWYLGFDNYPNDKWTLYNCVTKPNGNPHRKIIASTNPYLNVVRPSDDFIKEYCEKGGINEVMIEFEEIITHWDYDYHCVCGASLHIGNDEMKCDECGSYKIIKDKYPSKSYFQLKITSDNTVNIKNIKDSWNRKEIENFILQKLDIFYMNVESKNHRLPLEEEIKDFLREHL